MKPSADEYTVNLQPWLGGCDAVFDGFVQLIRPFCQYIRGSNWGVRGSGACQEAWLGVHRPPRPWKRGVMHNPTSDRRTKSTCRGLVTVLQMWSIGRVKSCNRNSVLCARRGPHAANRHTRCVFGQTQRPSQASCRLGARPRECAGEHDGLSLARHVTCTPSPRAAAPELSLSRHTFVDGMHPSDSSRSPQTAVASSTDETETTWSCSSSLVVPAAITSSGALAAGPCTSAAVSAACTTVPADTAAVPPAAATTCASQTAAATSALSPAAAAPGDACTSPPVAAACAVLPAAASASSTPARPWRRRRPPLATVRRSSTSARAATSRLSRTRKTRGGLMPSWLRALCERGQRRPWPSAAVLRGQWRARRWWTRRLV